MPQRTHTTCRRCSPLKYLLARYRIGTGLRANPVPGVPLLLTAFTPLLGLSKALTTAATQPGKR
ncbi:hypothetical protein CF58_30725 [Escherichia coli]|nr:hypothetical protein CF58_30725 [Escherichia coli]